ncbi:MarR family winged helix-turn-helix transcriptional regulator [Streptomyces sp. NPDC007264]|uniref:MarR family winged helix-turn-helix transcriptional regulator n=1 Tax=Streptomyces sp. NPDC007264 TaxID=3364777 RepID=UPI0036D981C9
MTHPTPVANGRLLGLTHYASRALLERVLARTGITFDQSVALRALVDHGGTVEHATLVTRLEDALKVADEAVARTAVDGLIADGLLEVSPEGRVSFTAGGRDLFDGLQAAAQEAASLLYAGIPQEDLETAGRVLTLVLKRANAELAA